VVLARHGDGAVKNVEEADVPRIPQSGVGAQAPPLGRALLTKYFEHVNGEAIAKYLTSVLAVDTKR
jgi:hypothetical protein